jgi:holo-[acyl-carrier protein] synthase
MGIRVGIDLASVADVADALALHGDRYLRRVFTVREIEDCRDAAGAVAPERLAARFAAKEAALKALGAAPDYGLALTSIEVTTAADGRPELALAGRATDLARTAGVAGLALSVTHEGAYAAAVVVAEMGAAS